MNTQQHRRFHLPFTTVSNRPGEPQQAQMADQQQQQQQQQQRGITRSFFDGIRNLRALKTASGMCGSCK